ncbi:MAG: Spore cortex-lytic enzyme precursor [Candidatus Accumulibacter adjunctus]|uniref:Spore cortex-lytic enzyme n=1 Tax=Candidatus Accumulibacter adjunctus TaxID=1454001 RepID=A0A011PIE6_9PROT|nr:MAG: Spore cortex-lytic enzyme precursor [Candidatus Accumulibacter adjunctus]
MSLWLISNRAAQRVDGVLNKGLFTEKRIALDTKQKNIDSGAPVRVLDLAPLDDVQDEWLFVEYADALDNDIFTPEESGWMLKRYLGSPLEQRSHPVDVERFTRDCAYVEMASANGAGEAEATVLAADYLIALAVIETKLRDLDTQLPGTDAIGPFQITDAEWSAFLASGVDDRFGPGQRFVPAYQIQCADFLTKRDWAAFVKAMPTAPEGEPVAPSYLNLFQARLIGPAAAAEIAKVVGATGGGQQTVDTAMRSAGIPAGEIDALATRRAKWLKKDGTWRTVADFDAHTETTLRDGLLHGHELLVQHFPDFVIAPSSDAAPWFGVASKEMTDWASPAEDLSETSEAGRKRITQQYFMATSYHPDRVEHWCGAFIAYCLASCDDQAIAESVVPGAAKAANWRNWGNVDLTAGSIDQVPKGAVVTLTKTSDSGPSGHVTFFVRRDGESNFIGLGGNQSNTVTESSYPIARISAVRWLNVAQDVGGIGFSRGTGDMAAISDEDKVIMAKTLWGEARSEQSDEAVKAVGAVILNRLASSRYPNTLAGVCRQPKQFSCWNSNDPNRAKIDALQETDRDFIRMRKIVDELIASGPQSVLPASVLHYHTATISADWSRGEPVFRRIGSHNFYANIA